MGMDRSVSTVTRSIFLPGNEKYPRQKPPGTPSRSVTTMESPESFNVVNTAVQTSSSMEKMRDIPLKKPSAR